MHEATASPASTLVLDRADFLDIREDDVFGLHTRREMTQPE
jgi:hypothetical protein